MKEQIERNCGYKTKNCLSSSKLHKKTLEYYFQTFWPLMIYLMSSVQFSEFFIFPVVAMACVFAHAKTFQVKALP